MAAMHVIRSGQNEQTYRGHFMNASCQILLYWANGFRGDFLEIDQPETI